MKVLKNKKKISASEQDKWTIRLLRQEVYCLEQELIYNSITKEEYNKRLSDIVKRLEVLERKYELCN